MREIWGMTKEGVKILTPKLLRKWVFEEDQQLKLVRPIGIDKITVAGEDFQHAWMGFPGIEVASAASISNTYGDDPALTYTLGGRSLNTVNPEFIFRELEAERAITIIILGEMLKKLGKTGIDVFDPFRKSA